MMNKDKPGRFPNTKAAVKMSLNKKIDGKTLIAMAIYILYFSINKVLLVLYPSAMDVIWVLFGDLIVGIVVWVICLLFNIDNPSVGKVFRDIGQFLWDLALDPESAIKEMRIWYAALGQRYMIEFDKLGKKISDGVIEVQKDPTKAEIIKKKVEESKIPLSGGTITGPVVTDGDKDVNLI